MIKQIIIFSLFFFASTISPGVNGATLIDLGRQKLKSGEELNVKIEIRTAGRLNKDSSNVIVMPTAFGQTTEDILRLTGPGKLADSTKFFAVLIGSPGNGVSTSPSNVSYHKTGQFPVFTVKDMVRLQKKIVSEHLKLKRIHAVVGGSLGGMQALEWTVLYPDMMKKAVIYVSTPVLSAPDIIHLHATLEIIENGWESGQSDREIGKSLALLSAMNAYTPDFWKRTTSNKDMKHVISNIQEKFLVKFDSEDHYSQVKAVLSHHITDSFDNSMEKTAQNIKADMLFIISKQDHALHPGPALVLAELTGAELLILDNDCGHYGPSCEKPLFYKTINTFLEK